MPYICHLWPRLLQWFSISLGSNIELYVHIHWHNQCHAMHGVNSLMWLEIRHRKPSTLCTYASWCVVYTDRHGGCDLNCKLLYMCLRTGIIIKGLGCTTRMFRIYSIYILPYSKNLLWNNFTWNSANFKPCIICLINIRWYIHISVM